MNSLPPPPRPSTDILRPLWTSVDDVLHLEYLTLERQFSSPAEFLQRLLIDGDMITGILAQLRTLDRSPSGSVALYHTLGARGPGNQ